MKGDPCEEAEMPEDDGDRLLVGPGGALSEHRVDCENPIQDEHGRFAGCEPGGGSGGGGGSSEGGSAPSSSPAPKAETIAKVREKRQIREIPTEKRLAHEQAVKAARDDVEAARAEIDKGAEDALKSLYDAQALSEDEGLVDTSVADDLTSLHSELADVTGAGGDEREYQGSGVETHEQFMDRHSGGEDGRDATEDPGPFEFQDEDVNEGESTEEARSRQETEHDAAVKAHEVFKSELADREERVTSNLTDAREKLAALQTLQAERAKALAAHEKAQDRAERASEKEIESVEDDGVVNDRAFKERLKGDDIIGEFSDPATQAEYDEAYDVGAHLLEQEQSARTIDAIDTGTAASSLKDAARSTAAAVKALDKILAKRAKAKK